jgi:hypothetical protein
MISRAHTFWHSSSNSGELPVEVDAHKSNVNKCLYHKHKNIQTLYFLLDCNRKINIKIVVIDGLFCVYHTKKRAQPVVYSAFNSSSISFYPFPMQFTDSAQAYDCLLDTGRAYGRHLSAIPLIHTTYFKYGERRNLKNINFIVVLFTSRTPLGVS